MITATSAPLFAQLGGVGGFGGPTSIGSGVRLTDAKELGIQPWISANGVYVRNLEGSTIFGNQRRDTVAGGVLGGLAASRLWRRTSLVGAYMGSAYYATRATNVDRLRSSHVGALALNHQFSRRVSLQLNQLAGSAVGGFGYGAGFSGFGALGIGPMGSIFSYGLLGGGGAGDPAVNDVVDSDIYDQRTNFYGSNGALSISPTNRFNFSLGGGGIFVRRQLAALNDLNAVNGVGTATYQLSRRLAVVASYGFGRFDYVRRFGSSDIQTGLGGFQFQLAERSFFSIFGGLQHLDRTFVGVVQVDPEVAELLGISNSYEIQAAQRKGFTGGAQFAHLFRQGDLNLSAWRGMTPGTDILLTSTRDRILGSFSKPLTPNDSLSFLGTYLRQKGLMQTGVRLDVWQAGGTYSRRIVSGLHIRFTAGYRRGESKLTNRQLRQVFTSIGLSWHPSDLILF